MLPLFATWLALQAPAAEPEPIPTPALDLAHPYARKKGKFKGPADRKRHKNYKAGGLFAATGFAAGAAGVVVLGVGWRTGELDATYLHTSAGLLSIGGLVGSSGALGAAIAADNATKKKSVPVVAGALGLTLGIFGPTFFGVGVGLDMPAFAWAAIGTGATSTLLTAVQIVQTDKRVPKRWVLRVDPASHGLQLAGTL